MSVRRDKSKVGRKLAASVAALRGMEKTSSYVVLEDLLSSLGSTSPTVAKLAGELLAIFGNREASQLGDATIKRLGEYAGDPFEPGPVPMLVDMLILTVKQSELEACQLAFGIKGKGKLLPEHQTRVWSGEMGGKSFALAKIGAQGNVRAALMVLDLARHFRPRLAILIGMAGRVQKAEVGHLVIPRHVYDYEFKTETPDGEDDQSLPYKAFGDYDGFFDDNNRLRSWQERFAQDLATLYSEFSKPNHMPQQSSIDTSTFELLTKPIMSGGKLFEAGQAKAKEEAFKVNTDIVAVEMEGAGFAAACDHLDWRWRIVRGIADEAQPERTKENQRLATYGAALYVQMFFPLLPLFNSSD